MVFLLSVAFAAEGVNRRLLGTNADRAKGALVACDILLQRQQQALGVLRGEDYATANTCLRQSWKHRCKVYDKLLGGVCDDCQVAVVTLTHLLVKLYLDTLFLSLAHSLTVLKLLELLCKSKK